MDLYLAEFAASIGQKTLSPCTNLFRHVKGRGLCSILTNGGLKDRTQESCFEDKPECIKDRE